MAHYAMLVDLTRCVGCHGCTVACQAKWDLLPEIQFTKVHRYEIGSFPEVKGGVVTTQCMHCDDPPVPGSALPGPPRKDLTVLSSSMRANVSAAVTASRPAPMTPGASTPSGVSSRSVISVTTL